MHRSCVLCWLSCTKAGHDVTSFGSRNVNTSRRALQRATAQSCGDGGNGGGSGESRSVSIRYRVVESHTKTKRLGWAGVGAGYRDAWMAAGSSRLLLVGTNSSSRHVLVASPAAARSGRRGVIVWSRLASPMRAQSPPRLPSAVHHPLAASGVRRRWCARREPEPSRAVRHQG